MYTPPRKKGPRRNEAQYTGKILLRLGDTVRVIAGKDKGKEGKDDADYAFRGPRGR